MMVLPFGMAMPNEVSVKEQPMPKITSARRGNFGTARGTARPPEPSDSGWSPETTTCRRGWW
jgi:hypothetical protein